MMQEHSHGEQNNTKSWLNSEARATNSQVLAFGGLACALGLVVGVGGMCVKNSWDELDECTARIAAEKAEALKAQAFTSEMETVLRVAQLTLDINTSLSTIYSSDGSNSLRKLFENPQKISSELNEAALNFRAANLAFDFETERGRAIASSYSSNVVTPAIKLIESLATVYDFNQRIPTFINGSAATEAAYEIGISAEQLRSALDRINNTYSVTIPSSIPLSFETTSK